MPVARRDAGACGRSRCQSRGGCPLQTAELRRRPVVGFKLGIQRCTLSWVTIVWSMTVWACLTLAALHLVIWCRRRYKFAFLRYREIGSSVAAIAGYELLAMRAENPG